MTDNEIVIEQLKVLKEKFDKQEQWVSSIVLQNAITVLSNPSILLELDEYLLKNLAKYWDQMGDTGNDTYFETATPKELVAYGKYRSFESVKNFLEKKYNNV